MAGLWSQARRQDPGLAEMILPLCSGPPIGVVKRVRSRGLRKQRPIGLVCHAFSATRLVQANDPALIKAGETGRLAARHTR